MYIPPDETRTIPFVMGLIPQLPVVSDVPLLRATTCLVVGKYASWLSKHPPYLSPLLPYLAQSLSIPKCATPAAVAIREICERCDTLGDTVLQLYDGIVVARAQHNNGGGGGEEFILDLKNELEVLEGVCKSVSGRVMIDPTIIQHLAQPMIDNLRAMAAPDANPSPKHISSEVCRLTTLVQHLRLPRPSQAQQQQQQAIGGTRLLNRSDFILSLMHETWPMLDILSQKYPRDFNCGEKLCRLHMWIGPVHTITSAVDQSNDNQLLDINIIFVSVFGERNYIRVWKRRYTCQVAVWYDVESCIDCL